MNSNIRIEVYKRLVLSKMLYKSAESACSISNDEISFIEGIMLLHDAVESALGAIADHLHASITKETYILKYYDIIEKYDPTNRPVPYKTQIRNLNTLRNNAKHQGIFPDPKTNVHFPTTVFALLEEICSTYLGLDFSKVSLKSLIENEDVLKYINQSEEQIEKGDYDNALTSLAYAMYHICEYTTVSGLAAFVSSKKDQGYPIIFTQPYTTEYQVGLLQHGVDPFLYYRFKNLTPKLSKKTETGELFHKWDKFYGHPANWTLRNVYFCLNFCIDTALKFQRQKDEGYTLINYFEAFEDTIESLKNEVAIWDKPSYESGSRKPILVLKKGETIKGAALDTENMLDEWVIYSKGLPSKSEKFLGFGFVRKNDVKVTPIRRNC